MPDFSFKKRERLSGKKSISALFETGRNVRAFPIRIIYSEVDSGSVPASVVISIPKRLIKNAVDRNLLKRRIREAYRLNKPDFYMKLSGLDKKIHMIILFQDSRIIDFSSLEQALIKGLINLLQQMKTEAKQ